MKITTSIDELSLGSVGIVAGYSLIYGGYIGKLISKGLIPGTFFVLLNSDLVRGTVQIMLKEKIIILSKPEVNALCIDAATEDNQ
ncbi:ferrous iron transport protein A [Waterburya agarophytonicola K14]|uniref:Ferrous iron transport protein A n=1 Tax=Waterburya agarophytonicola KI4 TaxID=2874699 RepID=A0A964BQR3_9CYAN|nr:FeoA family protein [Waterburya agarophytonicola]MCC0176476.1 ferrous iron transport protein A [Waterburya agarophytonicola KI4]